MTFEELFLTLLNRSLAACWLVLALLLLRPFLRKVSRSLCCALWGLVAFRLLCPFSIQSILSLIPSAEPIPTTLVQTPASGVDSSGLVINQTENAFATVPGSVAGTPMQAVLRIFAIMCLTGTVLLLLYALLSYLRLRFLVRESIKQEEGVWLCDRIRAPFILGVFRPRILLPIAVEPCDVPYILAHERAHLARRDHWRKPIAFALLAVFWFQPVLWIAYYLLRRDVEFACDERAIRSLGVEMGSKKLYAKALVRGSSPRANMLYCPLAFGGLQVKHRVNSVLTYKKPAAVRMLAALLVCAVVAVCFLTDPKVGANSFTDTIVDAQDGSEVKPAVPSDEVPHDTKKPTNILDDDRVQPDEETIDPKVYLEAGDIMRYCLCQLNSYSTQKENTFLFENTGDEDASMTFYVVYKDFGETDTSVFLGSEVVTIELPAESMTTYTFDPGYPFETMYAEIIGASYADVTWSCS